MQARLILLTSLEGDDLIQLHNVFASHAEVVVLNDLTALAAAITDGASMLAFGSGVIVPKAILERFKRPVYNLHAASPEFPGRDPHHHAILRGARSFGATLHIMTRHVDEGPIVAIERFDFTEGATPAELLGLANNAGMALLKRVGARLLEPEPMPALPGAEWGPVKTTRADLRRLAHISLLIHEEEFRRRYHALDGGAYDNLTLDFHGHLFRIDKNNLAVAHDTAPFAQFTEVAFRDILRQLKRGGYRFAGYGDTSDDRHVLWRHDVDFSMHRAARLAEIEAEEGVTATYFLNPRSAFYNLLEPEIERLTHRICAAGHRIGLHFDGGACESNIWTLETLDASVVRERLLLETILGAPVGAVSWHNPDLSNLLTFDGAMMGGVVNAYGARIRSDYTYASDSNGYWRFEPMGDVIARGHARLHLLSHPEWWTAEPMAPSLRVDRAIMGRARATRLNYDRLLARGGRKNVTPEDSQRTT
jgi:folate-dependent phosphoribosylglycinamide formyltransferase PurN